MHYVMILHNGILKLIFIEFLLITYFIYIYIGIYICVYIYIYNFSNLISFIFHLRRGSSDLRSSQLIGVTCVLYLKPAWNWQFSPIFSAQGTWGEAGNCSGHCQIRLSSKQGDKLSRAAVVYTNCNL